MVQKSGNALREQLLTMKRQMEVLFSESFKVENADRESPVHPGPWEPLMDVWEGADFWCLIADLPGVVDEDLHVELAEKKLTIRGNREASPGPEKIKAVQLERPAGTFSRTFTLPEDAQEESVKAEFRHGVLTVTVSKTRGPQVTSQKVQVRVG